MAAIAYYIGCLLNIVRLLRYQTKGSQPLGWPLSAGSSAAAAIPVIALAVWRSDTQAALSGQAGKLS